MAGSLEITKESIFIVYAVAIVFAQPIGKIDVPTSIVGTKKNLVL